MKEIQLTQGRAALVDDVDYDTLINHRWHLGSGGRYAARMKRGTKTDRSVLLMHRVIMGLTNENIQVDHIDGNKLNNQRSNLRLVTSSQNKMNTGILSTNTTGFKGVTYDKESKKYIAQIGINRKCIKIGRFDSISDAASARIEAERRYHGQYAMNLQID